MDENTEEVVSVCPECGNEVTSFWVKEGGCIYSDDYLLVASWIFHTKCWNKRVEEDPP